MRIQLGKLLLLTCFTAGFLGAAGCGEREHQKVRVEQRQTEGEVREVPPGTMVVE